MANRHIIWQLSHSASRKHMKVSGRGNWATFRAISTTIPHWVSLLFFPSRTVLLSLSGSQIHCLWQNWRLWLFSEAGKVVKTIRNTKWSIYRSYARITLFKPLATEFTQLPICERWGLGETCSSKAKTWHFSGTGQSASFLPSRPSFHRGIFPSNANFTYRASFLRGFHIKVADSGLGRIHFFSAISGFFGLPNRCSQSQTAWSYLMSRVHLNSKKREIQVREGVR